MTDVPRARFPWEAKSAKVLDRTPRSHRPMFRPPSTQNVNMTYEIEIEFLALCRTFTPEQRVKRTPDSTDSSHRQGPSTHFGEALVRRRVSPAHSAKGPGHRRVSSALSAKDLGLERGKKNDIPTSSAKGIEGGLDFLVGVLRDKHVDIVRGDQVFLGKSPSPPKNGTRWSAQTDSLLHHQWSLTINESITIDAKDADKAGSDGLILPLTLCTPTMTMVPDDWFEVLRVWDIIEQNYSIWTNESCGINVNVGMGKRPFSAGNLRDIGRLCWAFENVISEIHPEDRAKRGSVSIRQSSNLAQGMRLDDVKATGLYEKSGKQLPLVEGDKQLRLCQTVDQVATLLCSESAERLSVNFGNYKRSFVKEQNQAGRLVEPTIQFRQACHSVNSEWMCHWAAICAHTCWWAIYGDNNSRLEAIATRCSEAETGPASDRQALAIEFLTTIGCAGQINYMRQTDQVKRAEPRPRPAAS